jgi:hypothetical protein
MEDAALARRYIEVTERRGIDEGGDGTKNEDKGVTVTTNTTSAMMSGKI